MHDVLCGLSDFANVYINDILIFNRSVAKFFIHFTVLQWLCDKQLQAKHLKCKFLHSTQHLLGHIDSGKEIHLTWKGHDHFQAVSPYWHAYITLFSWLL